MPGARVLVVEDDRGVRDLLVALLSDEGYRVEAVDDGLAAVGAAESFRPHLAVVDAGLPGLDGHSLARRLKASLDLAVLFVTGADTPEDRRSGFRAGGDDYVTKPFDPEELALRVRAILRRSGAGGPELWCVGDLVVDEGARRVTRQGGEIALTETEWRLLAALVRRRGRVVPKAELVTEIWGAVDHATAHVLEVHLSALRRKLEASGPRLIHTVRGAGYVLRGPRPEGPPERENTPFRI